ncbi:MAG: protease inhibitor I42 family protein [Chloroflexi bacterium]|nr:protease inhibitor I42 family protein [Chloroflexota bacterium]
MKKTVPFSVLLLILLACSLITPPATPVSPSVTPDNSFCQPGCSINADSNGKTIQLNNGELLLVELDQNASTGYEWLVDKIEPDKLTNLGTDYSYGQNLPPGSGGLQLLCFKAANAGTTNLRLIYRRPWEVNVTPEPFAPSDFEITVNITP